MRIPFITLIIIGPLAAVVWTPCTEDAALKARQFFTVFNQQLDYDYPASNIVAHECQYDPNYLHDAIDYFAFRIPIKGAYQCVLYFVYDFRQRTDGRTGKKFVVNRLLQPWEPAYLSLLESAEDRDSDCTGIWEQIEERNSLERHKLRVNHDIFDQQTNTEIYGDYAERWLSVGGSEFMRLLGLLMGVLGEVVDIMDVKSRRKQPLMMPNYEVSFRDGRVLRFAVQKKDEAFDPKTFLWLESAQSFERKTAVEKETSYWFHD